VIASATRKAWNRLGPRTSEMHAASPLRICEAAHLRSGRGVVARALRGRGIRAGALPRPVAKKLLGPLIQYGRCFGAVGAAFELPARSARAPSRRRFGRRVAEKSRPSGPLVSRSPQGRRKCKIKQYLRAFSTLWVTFWVSIDPFRSSQTIGPRSARFSRKCNLHTLSQMLLIHPVTRRGKRT
jgi:hypothetical protein